MGQFGEQGVIRDGVGRQVENPAEGGVEIVFVAQISALPGDANGSVFEDQAEQHLALAQLLFGVLEVENVFADAERADDLPRLIAQGHLRGQRPPDAAVGEDLLFRQTENRLAGADDLLLVLERGAGVFFGEEVEIRLADQLGRARFAEIAGHRFAALEEAGLQVLEVHGVGDRLHEDVHETAFTLEPALGLFAPRDFAAQLLLGGCELGGGSPGALLQPGIPRLQLPRAPAQGTQQKNVDRGASERDQADHQQKSGPVIQPSRQGHAHNVRGGEDPD